MLELTAEARHQSQMLLSDCGTEVFAPALCHALNLAERGKFAEAASALSPWITDPAAADSRKALRERVEILTKWSESGEIDLGGYREFYLETGPAALRRRVQPILTLWQSDGVPQPDKYFLLADLLERREEVNGQALVLLAIPELPEINPPTAARAFLMAGNTLYRSGDVVSAEQARLRAKRYPPSTPAWPKAVFNLGVLEEERAGFHKAIEYFDALLSSNTNDKEPGANLMETNRNYSHTSALAISRCYKALGDYGQALHYAKLAKSQYAFVSWCGTCWQSASRSLNMRIAQLSARVYGLRAAGGIGLIVVAGLFYRRRRAGLGTSVDRNGLGTR